MCLVSVAWQAHPDWPLVLAGNRDELHDRASAAADWWPGEPVIFGGRDLVAGGSWLAVDRGGRLAVVTNYPGPEAGGESRRSRGLLVADFVRGTHTPAEFLDQVDPQRERYAGFCLIVATPDDARLAVFGADTKTPQRMLQPGVFTVSNSPLDQPWAKVGWLDEAVTAMLARGEVDPAALLGKLRDEQPVDGRAASIRNTPFVRGESYGTRASTVVAIDGRGECYFEERRYARDGRLLGASRTKFALGERL